MVFDDIGNVSLYFGLGPGIARALAHVSGTDFATVEPGRYELEQGCYCMVQDYETAPREQKRFEAHRQYVDVQFIASGEERIGHALIDTLREVEVYDESKDVVWFVGEGNFVTTCPGTFMILFPHDAHMPGVSVAQADAVRKVVVKVPIRGD